MAHGGLDDRSSPTGCVREIAMVKGERPEAGFFLFRGPNAVTVPGVRLTWRGGSARSVRRCAIHGVTALGEPSRVGGIPHRCKGGLGHVCAAHDYRTPRPTYGWLCWRWASVGRDRARYLTTRLSIPPVGTVRATFTAHGPRLVGLFSSLTSDMVPCVESIDYPGYPRSLEA
jgi:hypothetical protein